MEIKLEQSWKNLLADEFTKPYFSDLTGFVRAEYLKTEVFPPPKQIFAAMDLCPLDKVKVVILGQDPYHTPGAANGLAFSINPGRQLQPSLQNIFKEIHSDLGKEIPQDGDLTRWAEQGVLLLNATLTVRSGVPLSHHGKGWETFTDAIIHDLASTKENLVFMLWGRNAQKKGQFIDDSKHLILKSGHPSPLSVRMFSGCKHFSKCNEYLAAHGEQPIDW